MDIKSTVSGFLTQVAEVMGATALQTPDHGWVLSLDDTDVTMELSEDSKRLVLSVSLDQLPQSRKFEVAQMLLSMSLIAATGSGARFGLSGDDEIYLLRDTYLDQLSEASLVEEITQLLNAVKPWKEVIERAARDNETSLNDMHPMVRV